MRWLHGDDRRNLVCTLHAHRSYHGVIGADDDADVIMHNNAGISRRVVSDAAAARRGSIAAAAAVRSVVV